MYRRLKETKRTPRRSVKEGKKSLQRIQGEGASYPDKTETKKLPREGKLLIKEGKNSLQRK